MARYSKKELEKVYEEKAYWTKYADFFGWTLIGWTYKNSALFGRKEGGSVSVGGYGNITAEELDRAIAYQQNKTA